MVSEMEAANGFDAEAIFETAEVMRLSTITAYNVEFDLQMKVGANERVFRIRADVEYSFSEQVGEDSQYSWDLDEIGDWITEIGKEDSIDLDDVETEVNGIIDRVIEKN